MKNFLENTWQFFLPQHESLQHPFWSVIFLSIIFYVIFLLLQYIFIVVFKKISSFKKFSNYNLVVEFMQSISWIFLLPASFFLATKILQIQSAFLSAGYKIFLVLATVQTILSVKVFLKRGLNYLARNIDDPEESSFIQNIDWGANFFLWVIGVLFILVNLGYNINSLITGLGVGGIAIAFAMQSTLSDLFSAFSIYIDKPFKNGDFIVMGDESGTIIKTGFKSTRLRTLRGEELIIGNQQILQSQIKNFHDMQERRVNFFVRVSYHTSSEKILLAKKIIQEAIETTEKTRFDRVHFVEMAEYSFNFDVVFYVLSADYTDYVNIMENVNLKIVQNFEKEKIIFALPEQKIFLPKE